MTVAQSLLLSREDVFYTNIVQSDWAGRYDTLADAGYLFVSRGARSDVPQITASKTHPRGSPGTCTARRKSPVSSLGRLSRGPAEEKRSVRLVKTSPGEHASPTDWLPLQFPGACVTQLVFIKTVCMLHCVCIKHGWRQGVGGTKSCT